MDDLQHSREEINRIDKELAELFQQRMKCAKTIAAYKFEHHIPIRDLQREAALLEKNLAYVEDTFQPYYPAFLAQMMASSREYQEELMEQWKKEKPEDEF